VYTCARGRAGPCVCVDLGLFVIGVEPGTSTAPLSSREATSLGTPDNFGPPFTEGVFGGPAAPRRTLASEMARFDESLSLPATSVAGAADAAYAGKKEHPQGIWIHYPTGIYLSIQKDEFDAKAHKARSDATGSRLADGSPYMLLERINGRDTVIRVEGEPVEPDGYGSIHTKPGLKRHIQWNQDGWHYSIMPNGPRPASLELMRAVAASIR